MAYKPGVGKMGVDGSSKRALIKQTRERSVGSDGMHGV